MSPQSTRVKDIFSDLAAKDFQTSNLDKLQVALDIIGIEPSVGSLADGANAVISTLRAAWELISGNFSQSTSHAIDAGISAISLIPGADFIKLLKARKIQKPALIAGRTLKTAAEWNNMYQDIQVVMDAADLVIDTCKTDKQKAEQDFQSAVAAARPTFTGIGLVWTNAHANANASFQDWKAANPNATGKECTDQRKSLNAGIRSTVESARQSYYNGVKQAMQQARSARDAAVTPLNASITAQTAILDDEVANAEAELVTATQQLNTYLGV